MDAAMKQSVGIAFFRTGRPESDFYYPAGIKFAKVRPRIICADGFDVSVQAGQYLYSTPREDHGPWVEVEVGFPSAKPEPWDEWSKYAEDEKYPTGTVYAYVPLTLVEELIASHGGEAVAS